MYHKFKNIHSGSVGEIRGEEIAKSLLALGAEADELEDELPGRGKKGGCISKQHQFTIGEKTDEIILSCDNF